MVKVRVYELAKELGIHSKKLIQVLTDLNIEVKNHMSTIEEETAEKVVRILTGAGKTETKKIKETAAPEKIQKTLRQKPKLDKAEEKQEGRKARKAAQDKKSRSIVPKKQLSLEGRVTVGELAGKMEISAARLIKQLMELGIIANINQELDPEVIQLIAEEYDFEATIREDPAELELLESVAEETKTEMLKPRSPVVTVLGHVDHGKTTLLDAIRHTKVAAREAGGITQHIGAYQVNVNKKKVVFLDTPGHEAFTAMRARGAQVTDIAVLVVAADDGVMPQTVEAVNHAKAAGVPIVVAINKTDKKNANPDRVKQQLSENGLVPEEWGGDTIFVPVSAIKKENLDALLETILLVAEMNELKANPKKPARGVVIEGKLDKRRGSVATVLVQDGTLKIGDPLICGNISGKVRAMVDERGQRIRSAGPSTPAEVLGLASIPQAGDNFQVVNDERTARQLAEKRLGKFREATIKKFPRVSLDDLFKQIQEGEVKEVKLIVKGDVQGSVEALRDSLQKMGNEEVGLHIIHSGVGTVTESDVMLASASNAIIIGFNVQSEANVRKMIENEKVDLRLYRVIYDVLEDMKAAVKGLLAPKYKEVVLGQAEVRQLFRSSKVGVIAGCYVTSGKISRNASIRLIRDGVIIYEGKLASLKRFKEDVRDVSSGFECGILLENFNDLKEGDILEVYAMEEVKN